ncbi:MAG: AI-2E family transporter [Gemmatimonadaceae bacterium]
MTEPESADVPPSQVFEVDEPAGPRPSAPIERRDRTVGWHSKDVARAVALAMGIYLTIQLIWFANQLVLVAFLGVLFGLAVEAGVDRLERYRIPRGIGAALIVLGFFAMLVGVGAWITPTIRQQSVELRTKIPEAVDRVEAWLQKRRSGMFGAVFGGPGGPDRAGQTAAGQTTAGQTAGAHADSARAAAAAAPRLPGDSARAPGDTSRTPGGIAAPGPAETLSGSLGRQLGRVTRYVFPFLSHTVAVFAGLMLIIFMAIYIAADPDTYHRGLMHMFPHYMRDRAGDVLSSIATVLRRWLVTQMIAMAVIGTVTTIVLLILDVEAAFALGLIAGLMEFIPTIGPIISAVPAVAMGFLDSPEKALTVAAAYMGIQFLENHLLIPMLMKGGVDVPPVLTILGQALFTLLFGFLGLMVAVPLLAATMVAVKMLYVERVVGDDVAVLKKEEGG